MCNCNVYIQILQLLKPFVNLNSKGLLLVTIAYENQRFVGCVGSNYRAVYAPQH